MTLRARWLAARRRHILLASDGPFPLRGDGDSRAIASNGPPGAPALLAFHGFAGTPNEVRPITDVAAQLGWSVRAPRLSGHGPDAGTLLDVGWKDWSSQAIGALRELRTLSSAPVVVCGLSLGSLIATHLAAMFPDEVRGLVALSVATSLRLLPIALPLRLFDELRPFDNRLYVPKAGADIRDDAARARHMTYDVNPIAGATQVWRAGRVVRSELANVRCPTLVLHGRHDRVCPVRNARQFAAGLGTDDVQVAIMPRSGHIVSVDVDRDEVGKRVKNFLGRLAPP